MTNIILVLVKKTGEKKNALLQSIDLFTAQFVIPNSQLISLFDPQEFIRESMTLKELSEEYTFWNDKGYTIEPIFDDKEEFYRLIDELNEDPLKNVSLIEQAKFFGRM